MSAEKLLNNLLAAKEFLVTNGLGGYASGTYGFGNTRKYHGVLVAADQKLNRYNMVNRLEEQVMIKQKTYALSTNVYKNEVIHPQGNIYLKSFGLNGFPEWHYQLPGAKITKFLVQPRERNKTIVRYEIDSKIEGILSCRPLLTYRNIHELPAFTEKNLFEVQELRGELTIALTSGKSLLINSSFPKVELKRELYYDFYYPHEADRGYPALEDLQCLCEFIDEFPAGFTVLEIEFSYWDQEQPKHAAASYDYFAEYNESLVLQLKNLPKFKAPSLSRLGEILCKQAAQFIVKVPGKTSPSIIAGYHWFAEWGRDTFIAFPGLFLSSGNFQAGKALLLAWRKLLHKGLLPNTTIDLSYNSLDAVLWYVICLWQYYQKTRDQQFLIEINFLGLITEVWDNFVTGSNQVKLDDFGFLNDLNLDQALTWMDAKVNNRPVIDRSGRAVEIQALWYNFLEIATRVKKLLNDPKDLEVIKFTQTKLKTYFQQFFWLDKWQCLNDCVADRKKEIRLTPNQLIVLALPFSLLNPVQAKKVLKFCQQHFLTEVGLKTLLANDPNFHKYYRGDQNARDQAYHQGTIWPFLLGVYLKAYLQVNNYAKTAKAYVRKSLGKFLLNLQEQNLDYVPELFEAQTFLAKGCISQCWSAACLLEVIYLLKNN